MKRVQVIAPLGLALSFVCAAQADNDARFKVVPLVSDIAGMAPITDPNLRNPWGVTVPPGFGAFWVANQVTGVSTLYAGDVHGSPFVKNPLEVTIPGGIPTGQVFNGNSADLIVTSGAASGSALFLTDSLAGIISGWNPAVPPPPPATSAVLATSVPGAVYTGLAIGVPASGTTTLYAANINQGTIDVFDRTFAPSTVLGGFVHPHLKAGLRPFNVTRIGNSIFVTYTDPVVGDADGNGLVSEFTVDGVFMRNVARGIHLNQPWGVAIAPKGFGEFSGKLLVGNFGNGKINVFSPREAEFEGTLRAHRHGPIVLERLWSLLPGNGATAGDTKAIYFSAGIQAEQHGLFGKIVPDGRDHD